MKKRVVKFAFCLLSFFMSAAQAMQPLSAQDLSAAVVSTQSLPLTVGTQTAFVNLPIIPYCDSDLKSQQPCINRHSSDNFADEADLVALLLAQLPASERPLAWRFGDKQIMYIAVDLNHDDVFIKLGNNGAGLMLDDVTLHKNGTLAHLGPVSSSIELGERVDGVRKMTMYSNAELDFSAEIKAVRIVGSSPLYTQVGSLSGFDYGDYQRAGGLAVGVLRGSDYNARATSMGGLTLGNVLANSYSEISLKHD